MDLDADDAVMLSMVYLLLGTFSPQIDRQRYRCLRRGLYRFAADPSGDDDGIVINYPAPLERVDM